MAEARSAVLRPRVVKVAEGEQTDFVLAWQQWRRSILRRFFRTRNLIRNGMWPTSIWNLCALVAPLTAIQIFDWPALRPVTDKLNIVEEHLYLPDVCPVVVKSVLGSFAVGLGFFVVVLYVRRYLLRILLAYRGWMYEPPKSQSALTIVWAGLVRLISGYHPSLYSCQKSLPRMPVPPLKMTVENLLLSLKPLYGEDSEEYKSFQEGAKTFLSTIGPKLQRILVLRSLWVPNFVSDWWEKYVYLMGRAPLPINSSYYILDHSIWKPTHRQASRAASCIYQLMIMKQKMDREQLEALVIRNTIPICMAQYERVFSTVRIPGEDIDTIAHLDPSESKHVVVLRKGIYYKVDVFTKDGRLLTPQELEHQMEWILEDAEKHQGDLANGEDALPALTALDRPSWAKIRQKYFSADLNKESLDLVEGSVFFLCLDTFSSDNYSERAKQLLHGDGKCIWFDKSMSLVFFSNGRYGCNCEHSFADAPVVGHVQEYSLLHEVIGLFDKDGLCLPVGNYPKDSELVMPTRFLWSVDESLAAHIHKALQFHQQNADDLDICVKDFTTYGKGFIKKCKVSPDAFVQMALQVTYFKNAGKFALTYEASMTRLYLQGRTETVRTLSTDSVAFVKAFNDKSVSREEKIRLLRIACEKHAVKYKDAMNGKGIDRHLFALYVASRGLGHDSEFLKNVLSVPWTLSTSQQPQQQIGWAPSCSLPQYQDKISPGGGFGPVSDDGYGISYMIPGDQKFFFHISSKNSVKTTSSVQFMDQLFQTLYDIQDLFEGEDV